MGCGQPAGEAGFNIARVVAGLAGLDDVPGVTVNRYCSSSLQTIRMAAHAIKAGEGDCFIAAGVEAVSRYASGASDTAPNSIFKAPGERTSPSARGRPAVVDAAGGSARLLHRDGPDRGERRRTGERHPRGHGLLGQRSPAAAVAASGTGFFEDEITPLTLPDGTVVSKDDGPRAGTTVEGLAGAEARVPPRRAGHRRQCLPAERRRRRRAGDERHQGEGSSASPRWRASCRAVSPGSTPRSWASARSRPAGRRWLGPA